VGRNVDSGRTELPRAVRPVGHNLMRYTSAITRQFSSMSAENPNQNRPKSSDAIEAVQAPVEQDTSEEGERTLFGPNHVAELAQESADERLRKQMPPEGALVRVRRLDGTPEIPVEGMVRHDLDGNVGFWVSLPNVGADDSQIMEYFEPTDITGTLGSEGMSMKVASGKMYKIESLESDSEQEPTPKESEEAAEPIEIEPNIKTGDTVVITKESIKSGQTSKVEAGTMMTGTLSRDLSKGVTIVAATNRGLFNSGPVTRFTEDGNGGIVAETETSNYRIRKVPR
jgi:hypothetical protein